MTHSFEGIEHLGIAVSEIQSALTTYRDVLGFTVLGTERLEERGLEVAFLDAGGSRLELLAPLHGQSEVSGFLEKRGEGLHHICLRVPDLAQALDGLKQRGARLIDPTPRRGAGGHLVAFIHPKATHGLLIELTQHNAEGEEA